ncbi:MAG: hypothetical protein CMJ85_14215, partial [Planctomycetes bacterium]|nr:hypothetical protein [Planctomycetota bacterium]
MKPFLLITALITLLAACVTTQDTDAKLLAKAQAVHARVLTLDTHKDISALMAKDPPQETEARRRFRTRFDPSYRGSNQVDFPKMREGGLNCAFFIVYVGQGPLTKPGFQGAKRS